MDATKPNIPDLDELERELRDAAYQAEDGTLYVRASVAAKAIGIGPVLQTRWIKDGRITPMRFRVPRGSRAPRGILTAWPLEQAISCGRSYWTNSNRKWRHQEDEYLLDRIGKTPVDVIAKDLYRTPTAITQRATDLGVTQRNAQGLLTTGEIAVVCGVSREAVNYWCLKMNPPLAYKRLSTRDRVKLISLNSLRLFFQRHPGSLDRLSEKARGRIQRYLIPPGKRRRAVAA